MILDSIIDKPTENLQKFKDKNKITMWFGRRNPNWKKWTYDRMSKNYIRHCLNFIQILVNISAPNITKRILECEDEEMINYMQPDIVKKTLDGLEWDIIDTLGLLG